MTMGKIMMVSHYCDMMSLLSLGLGEQNVIKMWNKMCPLGFCDIFSGCRSIFREPEMSLARWFLNIVPQWWSSRRSTYIMRFSAQAGWSYLSLDVRRFTYVFTWLTYDFTWFTYIWLYLICLWFYLIYRWSSSSQTLQTATLPGGFSRFFSFIHEMTISEIHIMQAPSLLFAVLIYSNGVLEFHGRDWLVPPESEVTCHHSWAAPGRSPLFSLASAPAN